MVKAKDVALYFLHLDEDKTLFDKDSVMECNGSTFYVGNARLNKFLHLAQNIHIAKYSEPLFLEDIYAYNNGGVIKKIQENYPVLLAKRDQPYGDISQETKMFLTRLFNILKDAPVERLIELSHEDPEWKDKSIFQYGKRQIMDSMSRKEEYEERYEDIIELMDMMDRIAI